MALYDKWNRAQLRGMVRRELLDHKGVWWKDEEIDGWIEDWQNYLQQELNLIYGTATLTVTSSTLPLSSIGSDVAGPGWMWWDGVWVIPTAQETLEEVRPDWRDAQPSTPSIVFQADSSTLQFWPPPASPGTLIVEYPRLLTFATDTSTMEIPGWMKYSLRDYGAYRAYLRFGPNQDLTRAQRRFERFGKKVSFYKSLLENRFPTRILALSHGGRLSREIVNLAANGL